LNEPATGEVALAPAPQKSPVQISTVPRLIIEDRQAYVNEPLRLGLSLEGASGGEFLLLKGLEAATRLSAGKFVEPNSWRVSAFDLGNLFAYAPKDYVGTMAAVIDLLSADEPKAMASQVMRMEWVALVGRADATASSDRPPVQQVPALQLKLSPDETAMLLRRGRDMLQLGDITAARTVLRRAAEAGDSGAALLLASTFDPIVLREIGVVGFAPDPQQALSWYEKAFALGSGEAKGRIERLGHAGKR
jgi:TPR repeat protein